VILHHVDPARRLQYQETHVQPCRNAICHSILQPRLGEASMRLMIVLAVSALLSACEPAPANTAAADSLPICVAPIRKEVALSAPAAKDVLEFTAVGVTCPEAVILTTLRTADGKLLWTRSEMASETFAFINKDAGETPEEGIIRLMTSWAEIAEVSTTAAAPDWKEGAERPENETGLGFTTHFPREDYLAVRAASQPMLCHPFGVNQQVCVAYYSDEIARPLYELAS
jgi:hypothetical protein